MIFCYYSRSFLEQNTRFQHGCIIEEDFIFLDFALCSEFHLLHFVWNKFIELIACKQISLYSIIHKGLIVFQLDFNDSCDGTKRLGNALVVYDYYDLFLQPSQFVDLKVVALLSYFVFKNPLFTFFERDSSPLKLLNH